MTKRKTPKAAPKTPPSAPPKGRPKTRAKASPRAAKIPLVDRQYMAEVRAGRSRVGCISPDSLAGVAIDAGSMPASALGIEESDPVSGSDIDSDGETFIDAMERDNEAKEPIDAPPSTKPSARELPASPPPPAPGLGAQGLLGGVTPPPIATHFRCVRILPSGERAPLTYGQHPNGEFLNAWPCDIFSVETCAAWWGPGRYQAIWIVVDENGSPKMRGKSRMFDVGPTVSTPQAVAGHGFVRGPMGPTIDAPQALPGPMLPGMIAPSPVVPAQLMPMLSPETQAAIALHEYIEQATNRRMDSTLTVASTFIASERESRGSLERERLLMTQAQHRSTVAILEKSYAIALAKHEEEDDEDDEDDDEIVVAKDAPPAREAPPAVVVENPPATTMEQLARVMEAIPAPMREFASDETIKFLRSILDQMRGGKPAQASAGGAE